MAGFLYFIPNGLEFPREFESRFDGCKYERRVLGPGPGGLPGTMFGGQSYADTPQRIGFFPEKQTWRAFHDCWVGMYNDERPTPADLQRRQVLPGVPLSINGADWLVPIARQWNSEGKYTVALPMNGDLDACGNWKLGSVVSRYQQLWDACCKYWDFYSSSATITIADLFQLAVDSLAAQYHIDKIEAVMLGIVDQEACNSVMRIVCDLDSLEDIIDQKKTLDALYSFGG